MSKKKEASIKRIHEIATMTHAQTLKQISNRKGKCTHSGCNCAYLLGVLFSAENIIEEVDKFKHVK